MTLQTPESIARDFDRIAHLPIDPWDHNRLYLGVLLRELPVFAEDVLEVGCGTGELTEKLAARAGRVVALDLSAEMLAAAQARCAGRPNVELVRADVAAVPLAPASFDVVASVATLHHLPLAPTLARLRDALRPRGVLLVLDVSADARLADFARSLLAVPVNLAGRLLFTGRLRMSAAARAAWLEHGETDRYSSVDEVRAAARDVLPGARVRRHLLWRYSLVWRKPSQ